MRILLYILIINSFLFSLEYSISSSSIANGKTSLIEFKKRENTEYKKIVFQNKSFLIYENPFNTKKLYALLPVSYYDNPKELNATLHYEKNNVKEEYIFNLSIVRGKYEKEKIQVAKSKVNPNKKHKKRIAKEYSEAMNIYKTSTKNNYIQSKFVLPLESFITSDFGKARVYNDTLKGYHSGTDFRAKVGTPIGASNDGVVVLSKDRFYAGGTVILDHGQGIYTCYYHMSQLDVKVGQKIKKHSILGLSGKSGRVTGPHLHFSVRVSGVQVDPLQFVELINNTLLSDKNIK